MHVLTTLIDLIVSRLILATDLANVILLTREIIIAAFDRLLHLFERVLIVDEKTTILMEHIEERCHESNNEQLLYVCSIGIRMQKSTPVPFQFHSSATRHADPDR